MEQNYILKWGWREQKVREAREGLMKTVDQGGIVSTFFSLKVLKPSNLGTL